MNDDMVPLRSLVGISILYEGDLRDLAQFILRANDVRSASEGGKTRPTLHGLARTHGMILDVDPDSVERVIKAHGLYLGAIVEYDDQVAQHANAAEAAPPRR